MDDVEKEIQIALGTLTEYAVQFVFGQPPGGIWLSSIFKKYKVHETGNTTFWKNCSYSTIVFAINEKDALNIAREKAFDEKKWQKGLTDWQASDDPKIIAYIKNKQR